MKETIVEHYTKLGFKEDDKIFFLSKKTYQAVHKDATATVISISKNGSWKHYYQTYSASSQAVSKRLEVPSTTLGMLRAEVGLSKILGRAL